MHTASRARACGKWLKIQCSCGGFNICTSHLVNNSKTRRGNTCRVWSTCSAQEHILFHFPVFTQQPLALRATAEHYRTSMRLSWKFHLPKWVLGLVWAPSSVPAKGIQRDVPFGRTGFVLILCSQPIMNTDWQGGIHTGSCVRCVAGSAADLRCVPCFTPSLPESTDRAACTSTAQPRSADTQRLDVYTQPAAGCCCTTATSTQQLGCCSQTLGVGFVARPKRTGNPNFYYYILYPDKTCSHGS